jgi:hypothetical protein
MATTKLKKLFIACFEDKHIICQDENDRSMHYDENAEHNKSTFSDVLEYMKTAPLVSFTVDDASVSLVDGTFTVGEDEYEFTMEKEPLTDRKIIYYREMAQDFLMDGEGGEPYVVRYVLGYEGKNKDGKVEKKVIYIDG